MIGSLIVSGVEDDVFFIERNSQEKYWVPPTSEPPLAWAELSESVTVIAICEVIAVAPQAFNAEDLKQEHWANSELASVVPRRLQGQVRGMVRPGTLHFGVW